MTKTVVFDGLNLALRRGTGVATYTRVLAGLARSLGHRTAILYSRRSRPPRDALEREVDFFDAEMRKSWFDVDPVGKLGLFISALAGVRPQEIPITGTVLTAPLGNSWVSSDSVYAAAMVFGQAHALHALTGGLLAVRFPATADLCHWTFPLPMKSNARANIYTVHDLVPLRLPYTSLEWKRHYVQSMRTILAKADHVVTVSENTKHDIVKFFGIEEKRVTNTYEATDIPAHYTTLSEETVAAELSGVFGLEMRNYLLFYGSLEPKKNIGRIVQAYLAADVGIPLVVVFAQSWLAEDETGLLDQVIEREKDERIPHERKKIHRYEYLPFRLLAMLIRGARAVLFPSLYEGFGLPVLEGMTLGTPVITSNVSSIPEIAGDAALLVDPHNVDALKEAIVTICNDGDLCAELRSRGLKRAKLFSPDAYRERVDRLYRLFL